MIYRQSAIDAIEQLWDMSSVDGITASTVLKQVKTDIKNLPSAQPERLTDDDFETIRIHLSAFKERLCNQHRWKEAEEYQRIIDRFMAFASAQPEPLTDKEQRIFLVAMAREENVCEEVDREYGYVREPYEDTLVQVCKEIRRKVKDTLWT